MATLLAAMAGALGQVMRALQSPDRRTDTLHLLQKSAPWALALALAQAVLILASFFSPVFTAAASTAWFYFIGAAALPVLWAAGTENARSLGWPTGRQTVPASRALFITLLIYLAGMALSALLFWAGRVEPGESLRTMADDASRPTAALAIFAVWLLLNAPWLEELVFRHFAIPALARAFGGSRGAIILAVIGASVPFALGHSGYTIPIWPKLVQMLVWAAALSGLRIYLGTRYAIGLHLAWNLSTPLIALMLQ